MVYAQPNFHLATSDNQLNRKFVEALSGDKIAYIGCLFSLSSSLSKYMTWPVATWKLQGHICCSALTLA